MGPLQTARPPREMHAVSHIVLYLAPLRVPCLLVLRMGGPGCNPGQTRQHAVQCRAAATLTLAGCAEASKTEGNVLSVIAGKEGAAKFSETTKKLAEGTTKKLAETPQKVVKVVDEIKVVHASPGGFAAWTDSSKLKDTFRKSTVPKPDDFFSDVGDEFGSPSKSAAAKAAGPAFDDDFDFFAPSKPAGKKQEVSRQAPGSDDPELSGSGAARPADTRKGDAAKHESPPAPPGVNTSQASDGGGNEGEDGWCADLDLDSLAEKLGIAKDMATADATAAATSASGGSSSPQAAATLAQEPQGASATRRDKGDGGNGGDGEGDDDAAMPTAAGSPAPQDGDAVAGRDAHEAAATMPASAVSEGKGAGSDAIAAVVGGTGKGECDVCKEREASLKGAVARLTRVSEEKDTLRAKVLELEKSAAQLHEALARKAAQQQQAVETQEQLEVMAALCCSVCVGWVGLCWLCRWSISGV